MQKTLSPTFKITFSLFCFLILFFFNQSTFLSGYNAYLHDSTVISNKLFIFYDSIFRGVLPLWSFESNSGQPLWPTLEMTPVFDPLSLLVWGTCFLFKTSSATAMAWTYFGWWLIFCVGASLCSRFIEKDWALSLIVFTALFAGPIAPALGFQAHGFLVPFTYLPLAIYCFLKFLEKPSYANAVHFGMTLAFALSGYQFPYPLVFFSLFLASLILFDKAGRTYFLKLLPKFALSFFIAILFLLPSILSGIECFYLFMAGRFGNAWFPTFKMIFFGMIDVFHKEGATHGHGYIGLIPFFILVALLFSVIKNRLSLLGKDKFSPLEKTWFTVTLATLFICLGAEMILKSFSGTLFFMRNWGFTLTLFFFALLQCVAIGYRYFNLKRVGLFLLAFAVLDSAFFLNSATEHYHSLYPFAEKANTEAPLLGQRHDPKTLGTRTWLADLKKHFPYTFESPSVFKEFTAASPAFLTENLMGIAPHASHWAETSPYRFLLNSGLSETTLKELLRVGKSPAFIPRQVIYTASADETLRVIKMMKRKLSTDNTVFIEGSEIKNSVLSTELKNKTTLKLVSITHSQVLFSVNNLKPSLITFMDNYTPDWKVSVDSQNMPLLKANITGKAVSVASGEHLVSFSYEPKRYQTAFWIRAFILGSYFVLLLVRLLAVFRYGISHFSLPLSISKNSPADSPA